MSTHTVNPKTIGVGPDNNAAFKESTHTPGPWINEYHTVRGSDGHRIAFIAQTNDEPREHADAALIVKAPMAPKLAEALRAFLTAAPSDAIKATEYGSALRDQMRAALAEWDNAK